MVQYNPTVQGSTPGSNLVDILTDWESALMSSHSGETRPENIIAGGVWVKVISSTSWELVLYDGTNDLVIASINPDTSTINFNSGALTGLIDADTLNGVSNYNKFRTGTSDPNGSVTGVESGELYYDTTNNLAYFYSGTGTIWNKLGSSSSIRTLTSASDTELASDQIIALDATSNSIDFNLLASNSGNEGKIIEIKRVDTLIANEVRINPNGSETISGLSQIKLRRKGESVKILSRNNNREILNCNNCSLISDSSQFKSHTNCRAWVNFNGVGTLTIQDSFNISSVTDNGTGNYTINFQDPMPNSNYAFLGSSHYASGGIGGLNRRGVSFYGISNSSISVITGFITPSTQALSDIGLVSVGIFV